MSFVITVLISLVSYFGVSFCLPLVSFFSYVRRSQFIYFGRSVFFCIMYVFSFFGLLVIYLVQFVLS